MTDGGQGFKNEKPWADREKGKGGFEPGAVSLSGLTPQLASGHPRMTTLRHRLTSLVLTASLLAGCAREDASESQFVSAKGDDITFTWAWGVGAPGADDGLTCWYRSKIDLDDFTRDQKERGKSDEEELKASIERLRTDRGFAAAQLTEDVKALNAHAFLCRSFRDALQARQRSDDDFLKDAKLDAICRMSALSTPSTPGASNAATSSNAPAASQDPAQLNIAPLVAVGIAVLAVQVVGALRDKRSLGEIAGLLAQNLPALIPGAGPYVAAAMTAYQALQASRASTASALALADNANAEAPPADTANFGAESHPVVSDGDMKSILDKLESFGRNENLGAGAKAPKCPGSDEIRGLLRGDTASR